MSSLANDRRFRYVTDQHLVLIPTSVFESSTPRQRPRRLALGSHNGPLGKLPKTRASPAFMDVLAKAEVHIFDYPASDLKDEIEV